jgi:hypothetical protein
MRGTTLALAVGTAVALVEIGAGSANVEVAAVTRDDADRTIVAISEALGAKADDPNLVPMNFWAIGQHGPRSARRRIAALPWSEIQANYETKTAAAVAKLLQAEAPGAGRLILWHGAPGTGKTHALRALARAWTGWFSTQVITDPEAFLGAGTSYLMDVLTSHDAEHRNRPDSWKLVVLEDAGEFLSEDAHHRTGQALSRLLNVTDGMLGQGMNTIVLVSTNEPLSRLHPAVRRAGRCWCEIEFGALDTLAANRWLEDRDSNARVTSPPVLANLYALTRGEDLEEDPKPFGFAVAR